MHEITDADFREFVKTVQNVALRAYPNPDRVNCPGSESQVQAARCMVHGLPYKQRKFQIGAQAEFESQRGHHAGVVVW